jgi:ketoreductase RED2
VQRVNRTGPPSFDSLDDKVAIVTGSSAGIGLAIARAFALGGVRTIINGRGESRDGAEAADSLPQAMYVAADVSEELGCDLLVESALKRWGRLDILVNNAGITARVPHSDLKGADLAVWHRIFATNLFGAWSMVRSAEPHLRATHGQIINVSSVAGIRPGGSSIPYSVSKAALNHLTLLLAKALAPDVRVNAIAPGLVDTRWNDGLDELKRTSALRSPLQRIGTAEDVAKVCVSLLSASFVTGEIVTVDGGDHLV